MVYKNTLILLLLALANLWGVLAFSQNVDEFNRSLEEEANAISDNATNKKQLTVSVGYKHLYWNYDVVKLISDDGGAESTLNQSSSYDGLSIYIKSIFPRPIRFLLAGEVFLPFAIKESVHPVSGNSGARVVSTNYVLKNIASNLKGLGLNLIFGPTTSFAVSSNTITSTLSGGLVWSSFTDDLGGKNRHSSLIGIGADIDWQWHVTETFALSLGVKGSYLPISLFSANMDVQGFDLQTNYMTDLGVNAGAVWTF